MDNRALDNWIEAFLAYTASLPSPEIYRRWTALGIVAGALERRVWTRVSGSFLYPNCFVLLVGPPGVGKSMSVREAHAFWSKTGLFNVAPSGMTKAAFLDQLGEKPKFFEHDGVTQLYNGMLIAAPEFSTLLPENDTRFLGAMNDTYDCNSVIEDRIRTGGKLHIDRPVVTMIAGTQPQYLGQVLPESAYGQGFPSRLVLVYAGRRVVIDIFKAAMRPVDLHANLVADLITIGKLAGEFEWEKAAEAAVEDWNRHAERDAPTHPRLLNYNVRRVIHAVKLSMATSAARSNELVVTLSDFESTKSLLLAAEALMPEIFKEMATSQDANEITEMHEFMFSYCRAQDVDAVPEHKLIQFMSQRVPVNRIDYFIEALAGTGMMEITGLNLKGRRMFKPKQISLYAIKPTK